MKNAVIAIALAVAALSGGCRQHPPGGAGIAVFILDSGVNPRHVGGDVDGDDETGIGHGSQVARVIRSQCPGCPIISLTLMGPLQQIEQPKIYSAFIRILAFTQDHPRTRVVANISLGSYEYDPCQHALVMELQRRRVVLVAAAGNDNTDRPFFPAGFAESLSVAAVSEATKRKTDYSNWGTAVDLAAFGTTHQIDVQLMGYRQSSASGTSFAAPLVTGLLARILWRHPGWTSADALRLLVNTSVPGPDDYFRRRLLGRGVVQPQAVLQALYGSDRLRALLFWLLTIGCALLALALPGRQLLRIRHFWKRIGCLSNRSDERSLAAIIHRLHQFNLLGQTVGLLALAATLLAGYANRLSLETGLKRGILIGIMLWLAVAKLPRLVIRFNPEYRDSDLRLRAAQKRIQDNLYLFRNGFAFPQLRRRALQNLADLGEQGMIPDFHHLLDELALIEKNPQLKNALLAEMNHLTTGRPLAGQTTGRRHG